MAPPQSHNLLEWELKQHFMEVFHDILDNINHPCPRSSIPPEQPFLLER